MVVTTYDGSEVRLKAPGRLGEAARSLERVFQAIAIPVERKGSCVARCGSCERDLDRDYAYCPFCGEKREK